MYLSFCYEGWMDGYIISNLMGPPRTLSGHPTDPMVRDLLMSSRAAEKDGILVQTWVG